MFDGDQCLNGCKDSGLLMAAINNTYTSKISICEVFFKKNVLVK